MTTARSASYQLMAQESSQLFCFLSSLSHFSVCNRNCSIGTFRMRDPLIQQVCRKIRDALGIESHQLEVPQLAKFEKGDCRQKTAWSPDTQSLASLLRTSSS